MSALAVAGCGDDPAADSRVRSAPIGEGIVQSPMLFDVERGLNEFELMFDNGLYHLYFHDFEDLARLKLRIAPTVEGLAGAPDQPVGVLGVYPSVVRDEAGVHLHVWDGGRVVHHVAARPTGPWTRINAWPVGFTDPCVVQSPLDGRYYAGCKRITGRVPTFAVLAADTVAGPWTDLGDVLGALAPQGWYEREQADGCVWFQQGRMYGAFAGYDGAQQVVGVVDMDPANARARAPARIVVRPERPWQRTGGVCKVFNPKFVAGNATDPADRLYFAHNAGHLGRFRARRAGWAYVEGFARG